jgi:hypothetical protein
MAQGMNLLDAREQAKPKRLRGVPEDPMRDMSDFYESAKSTKERNLATCTQRAQERDSSAKACRQPISIADSRVEAAGIDA